jgi:2-desacetyl-2-hydroxyethyl bacteriochlorophyllide A dehydrogenase
MKTLVCTAPGNFEYRTREKPFLTKGNAILRIKRVGICGTDLHAYEGTQPFFNYPRVLGHELSGDLIDVDGATDFLPGEAVSIIPYFNCGTCIACRTGKPNCCVAINVCGVHIDGGMTEYLSIPSYSLLHGNGLDHDAMALIEPLAIGAHGVARADVKPGEFVLVIGAGPIGLGVMEFARIAGATVIAMDVNTNRLNFCKTKLKIQHCINAGDGDVLEQLKAVTNGDMPTVVIDATGNLKAINNAFQYLAHTGKYVLVGLQRDAINISHPEFHKREATLMSSRNATRRDFDHVIDCMKRGDVNPVNYITHCVAFDDVKESFSKWLRPETGVIKAMVNFF